MDSTPACTPSRAPLPSGIEAAEVLSMDEAAALLGLDVGAIRIWIAGRRNPYPVSAGAPPHPPELVRPIRYFVPAPKEPGKPRGKPRVRFLRREIEALNAQIDGLFRPVPHPDAEHFPGCHMVPIAVRSGCERSKGPRGRHVLIDSADLPLVNWGGRLIVIGRSSDRPSDAEKGVVVFSRNHHIPFKQIVLGVRTIDPAVPLVEQPPSPPAGGVRIIHRNGDILDCRRSNLEVVEQVQVSAGNSKMTGRLGETLTSRFKGVSWQQQRELWCAHICCRGTRYYLGGFDEEEDAAREYDNTARWLFGEPYARLNFSLERPALRIPHAGALSKPGVIERLAAAREEGERGAAAA